jgi:SGNH domain (fused to AT3 domains)
MSGACGLGRRPWRAGRVDTTRVLPGGHEEDGGAVRRRDGRGLMGAACLVGCVAASLLGTLGIAARAASPPAAPTAMARVDGAGARIGVTLPPGLSGPEHAQLVQAGAYGSHPVRLLILGDSIAMTLGMGLSLGARSAYGVTVADHATVGCDLDPQLEVFTSGQAGPATPGCDDWRALWPFLVAQARPQVVALGLGRWEVTDHLLHGSWVHVGEPVWDAHLTADLRDAISIFHTFGARVVLFTMPYVDPPERQPDGMPWAEDSPERARAYNAVVEHVATLEPAGEVTVIDLNRMLSPGGVYTAAVGGVDVRSADGIHVSLPGGVLLQRQILPAVDRIGMEDETAAKAGV